MTNENLERVKFYLSEYMQKRKSDKEFAKVWKDSLKDFRIWLGSQNPNQTKGK